MQTDTLLAPLFLGGGDSLSWIFQIVFYLLFIVFVLYGQRIQMIVMLREIEGYLRRLKYIRDEGRKIGIKTIKEIGKPEADPTERVDQFLEYVTIAPQSMDPAGIVWKLEHILDVREDRFKDDVKEVQTGYECGIGIENFNDIKVGDVLECYYLEEIRPEME